GIMLFDGVLRLARFYGVQAGRRAVVLGDLRESSHRADQLKELGVEVVAQIQYPPLAPTSDGPVIQARGRKHLEAVRLARVNGRGRVAANLQEFACDLLCLATEPIPANELLLQGGMRFRYEFGHWRPAGSVPGLLAAGGAAGMVDLES